MKVVLRIFIPLCIFSFIAFGISVMFLGTDHSTDDMVTSELVISDSGANSYDITDSFTIIKADAGACKLNIKPWSEQKTQVTVSGGAENRVRAGVSGDTLNICSEWSWSSSWFTNLLNGSAFKTEITVRVPDKTYEQLRLTVGAGTLSCDDIKAKEVFLNVSAGTLTYTQPENFRAEDIVSDVSAGNLIARNADTARYEVDVSAGSASIYGLTGNGRIDVSAGTAKLQYADFSEGCDVDVSAGDVYLDIPEDSSVRFNCDKSAGDIRIMVGDENRHAADGDVISINGGKTNVNLSVSAGDIKVVNSTASAVEADNIVAATELTSGTAAESVTTMFTETTATEE